VDRVGDGGGVPGEDVRVVRRRAHELFAQLEKRQMEDPKLASRPIGCKITSAA
jgi:hypothetical protein